MSLQLSLAVQNDDLLSFSDNYNALHQEYGKEIKSYMTPVQMANVISDKLISIASQNLQAAISSDEHSKHS